MPEIVYPKEGCKHSWTTGKTDGKTTKFCRKCGMRWSEFLKLIRRK